LAAELHFARGASFNADAYLVGDFTGRISGAFGGATARERAPTMILCWQTPRSYFDKV
jgi:hypothetical protein